MLSETNRLSTHAKNVARRTGGRARGDSGACTKCGRHGHYAQTCELASRGLRRCYKCREVKPLEKFSKDGAKGSGRAYLCRRCLKAKELARDIRVGRKRHHTRALIERVLRVAWCEWTGAAIAPDGKILPLLARLIQQPIRTKAPRS